MNTFLSKTFFSILINAPLSLEFLDCNCALARTLYTIIEAFSIMIFQLLLKNWCLVHCENCFEKNLPKLWEIIFPKLFPLFWRMKNVKISRFFDMKTFYIENTLMHKNSIFWQKNHAFLLKYSFVKNCQLLKRPFLTNMRRVEFYKSWCFRVSPAHQFILLTIA